MWAPLWAVFGEVDPAQYDWLVSAVLWIYILMGSIVLVNLLIAMFTSTFERVQVSHSAPARASSSLIAHRRRSRRTTALSQPTIPWCGRRRPISSSCCWSVNGCLSTSTP